MKFVAKSEINGNAWASAAEIGIQASADVTGINQIEAQQKNDDNIYDMQGRKMAAPLSALPQGIYIRNGKKIAK